MVFSQKLLILACLTAALSNCSPANSSSQQNVNANDTAINTSFKIATSAIIIPDDSSCSFNGQVVLNGESINAFQNSSVAYGSQCVSETRTCAQASLSGSYQYSSCAVDQPASCLFNGVTVAHGASVDAFQNSTVAFGSACVSESRTCNNGVLSGSAQYASCAVNAAASCLFNGKTIDNGKSIRTFISSTAAYGASCQFEDRTCNNGVLSGSYQFETCDVGAPASCSFNGVTIAHGQVAKAFQNSSVNYGNSCVAEDRTCNNGVLSGSYQFSSCDVGTAASCLFNGQTVAHGQIVTAFASSSVQYGSTCSSEQRTCDNGVLSGTNKYASCEVGTAASCLFNGQTVAHGQIVTAFASSSVQYGSTCSSEQRTCDNGVLSGSAQYASCAVNTAASCLFNGQTIAHGQIVTGFTSSSVQYGSTCSSEQRTCNNGVLSGSAQYASCAVDKPASCSFNNVVVAHGTSVLAYKSSTAAAGTTCVSEQRTCSNGVLSGSYAQASCTVQNPPPPPQLKSCKINNTVLASGEVIKLYKSSSVPYGSSCEVETRKCTDGVLSGSAIFQSCSVLPKPPVDVPPTCHGDKDDDDDKDHHGHKDKHHGHDKKPCKDKHHGHDKKPCKDKHHGHDKKPCKDKHHGHDKKPCEHKDKDHDKNKKPCDHKKEDKDDHKEKKPCDDKKEKHDDKDHDKNKKPCDKKAKHGDDKDGHHSGKKPCAKK